MRLRTEGDYAMAAALYQEKVRVQEQLLAQQAQAWQQAFQEKQFAYQQQQDLLAAQQYQEQFDYQKLLDQQKLNYQKGQDANKAAETRREQLIEAGQLYLQMGYMPTDEMLEAMDLDPDLAVDIILELKEQAATGQGGGKAGGMTLTTAKQSAAAGYFSDAVLAVLRENGYDDEMLARIYGYTGGQTGLVPFYGEESGSPHPVGMSESNFQAAMNTIMTQLASGNTSAAVSGIETIWDQLNTNRAGLQESLPHFYIKPQDCAMNVLSS